jgi:hypothetical protein
VDELGPVLGTGSDGMSRPHTPARRSTMLR